MQKLRLMCQTLNTWGWDQSGTAKDRAHVCPELTSRSSFAVSLTQRRQTGLISFKTTAAQPAMQSALPRLLRQHVPQLS